MRFGSILVLLACAAGVSPVRARPIPEPTRGKAPVDSSAERTQRKFSWNEASRPSRHTSNSLRPLVRDAIDRWLDEAPQNLNLSNRKVFDQIKKVESRFNRLIRRWQRLILVLCQQLMTRLGTRSAGVTESTTM